MARCLKHVVVFAICKVGPNVCRERRRRLKRRVSRRRNPTSSHEQRIVAEGDEQTIDYIPPKFCLSPSATVSPNDRDVGLRSLAFAYPTLYCRSPSATVRNRSKASIKSSNSLTLRQKKLIVSHCPKITNLFSRTASCLCPIQLTRYRAAVDAQRLTNRRNFCQ